MTIYEISFNRIERVRAKIRAKNKSEVLEIFKNNDWDLDTEKTDEIENKGLKITWEEKETETQVI